MDSHEETDTDTTGGYLDGGVISFHLLVDGPLNELLVGLKNLMLGFGERVDHRLQLLDDGILLIQVFLAQGSQLFFHIVHILARALIKTKAVGHWITQGTDARRRTKQRLGNQHFFQGQRTF